jgi:hypothetical protein
MFLIMCSLFPLPLSSPCGLLSAYPFCHIPQAPGQRWARSFLQSSLRQWCGFFLVGSWSTFSPSASSTDDQRLSTQVQNPSLFPFLYPSRTTPIPHSIFLLCLIAGEVLLQTFSAFVDCDIPSMTFYTSPRYSKGFICLRLVTRHLYVLLFICCSLHYFCYHINLFNYPMKTHYTINTYGTVLGLWTTAVYPRPSLHFERE